MRVPGFSHSYEPLVHYLSPGECRPKIRMMSRLWTVVVGQLWKPFLASPRPPKTIFPVDRTMPEVAVWLYSEAKADQQWCMRRTLAQWQLDVSLWIQKRRKLLKQLPAHFTHTAASHVLHFIAVLKTFLLNLSTEVSFLKGNKAFSSFFLVLPAILQQKGLFHELNTPS